MPASRRLLRTGQVLSGLIVLFLTFDGAAKLARVAPVVVAFKELEIPDDLIQAIGATLLVCTVLYAIPRTAVLGAILITGYLGGAIETHVRMHGPVFPIVFSSLMGMLTWLGLYFREPRLRALVPLRS